MDGNGTIWVPKPLSFFMINAPNEKFPLWCDCLSCACEVATPCYIEVPVPNAILFKTTQLLRLKRLVVSFLVTCLGSNSHSSFRGACPKPKLRHVKIRKSEKRATIPRSSCIEKSGHQHRHRASNNYGDIR
jgi:hypothetical protein